MQDSGTQVRVAILNEFKKRNHSFSQQLVYFLIETRVKGYALVDLDNSPIISWMAKLSAKHYITYLYQNDTFRD
jgi:hypothetical protein